MCEGGGGRSGVALRAGGGGERSPGARGGGGLSRRRSGAGPARACDCGERGGAALAKCCLRSTTPPVFPRWAGPRLGSRALACWGWGTIKGSPACGFGARLGGGVKSAFLRLLGIRLAGGAVRSGDATPPGSPPLPPGFRLLGK